LGTPIPPWDSVRPVWQLRVGDFRVFYDVDEMRQEVIVRAIRRKGKNTTKEIL
jgi:mRNA-degrading endonuclease RelE of RelBE toxin-antitoxin system